MKTLLFTTLAFCFTCSAYSQLLKLDTITVGSTTYKDVTVTNINPDSITISYDAGILRIPYEQLSPSLQKLFNFSPEQAQSARVEQDKEMQKAAELSKQKQKLIEEQKELEQRSKNYIAVHFSVGKVVDGGYVVGSITGVITTSNNDMLKQIPGRYDYIVISHFPNLQNVAENDSYDVILITDGIYSKGDRRVRQYRYIGEYKW